MKNIYVIILTVIFTACSSSGEKKTETHSSDVDHSAHMAENNEQSKSKSPKQMAMANVGDNHIHIEYSSPSVRGRQIFGGLVAYGEVWVTGAHKATNINFQKDVMINETPIPAGKYGFFTIPGKESWTIILSQDWDMHLADDYNPENDVLRFDVVPVMLEKPVESLTYEVIETDDSSGKIKMSWADVSISFGVKNQ